MILSLLRWLLSLLGRRQPPPPPAPPEPDLDARWKRCSRWVLQREGGFVDDPRDPGGATNMGVTIGELSVHLGRPATVADVRNLSEDVAVSIYYHDYWHANRCDEMPAGVDLAVMDAIVMTSGVRVRKWLQSVLHVTQDGVLGEETMSALSSASPSNVILNLAQTRMNYYHTLPVFPTFGDGWSARVQATTTAALEDSSPAAVPQS